MVYVIDKPETTKCFQQKYVYPGKDQWIAIQKCVVEFIQTKRYMYNGGWSIHYFLAQIDENLKIYDENDICDTTDFDMFGPTPCEDLVGLAQHLKNNIPDMNFTVNNGLHPNQYTVGINYLGVKLVDWIYITPVVYDFVPSITYKSGITTLHPLIELLRQYNMLSNMFLMAPDKDMDKVLFRIDMLEKHALIPWIREKGFAIPKKSESAIVKMTGKNVKNSSGGSSVLVPVPLTLSSAAVAVPSTTMPKKPQQQLKNPNKNTPSQQSPSNNSTTDSILVEALALQHNIDTLWVKAQKYVCYVGYRAFIDHVSMPHHNHVFYPIDCALHDAVFGKCFVNLLSFVRTQMQNLMLNPKDVQITGHISFIGVIGPLYNGWIEIAHRGLTIFRLFSLATPVHVTNPTTRVCSYFFNMAHMMWWSLYLKFIGRSKDEVDVFYTMTCLAYLAYLKNKTSDPFILRIQREYAVGVMPARNFYMMSNMLRAYGNGFKYSVVKKQEENVKKNNVVVIDIKKNTNNITNNKNHNNHNNHHNHHRDERQKGECDYKVYDGRVLFTFDVASKPHKMPELPFLYARLIQSSKSKSDDHESKANRHQNNKHKSKRKM
jgi:hypothetical protein